MCWIQYPGGGCSASSNVELCHVKVLIVLLDHNDKSNTVLGLKPGMGDLISIIIIIMITVFVFTW